MSPYPADDVAPVPQATVALLSEWVPLTWPTSNCSNITVPQPFLDPQGCWLILHKVTLKVYHNDAPAHLLENLSPTCQSIFFDSPGCDALRTDKKSPFSARWPSTYMTLADQCCALEQVL